MLTAHLPAPLWRRLAAIVYDTLLVAAIALLVGFINLGWQLAYYGQTALYAMTERGVTLDSPLFYGALLLTVTGFFVLCWTRTGQTLGMQAWRIQIIDERGQCISFKQSLLRCVVAVPALLFGLVGVFWMKLNRQQQSWQDLLSGSRTVLLPKRR